MRTRFPDASRKVTRSQLVIAASEAVRFALLLCLTAILGRALDEAAFGFVTLVPSIYLVAHVVLDLGTGALIARESARHPERERPLLEASLFVRAIAGAALGVVVVAFALHETDPVRRFWLFATAVTLPALAPAVLGSAFRVRQDLLAPAVLTIGTILLMIAATLFGLHRHIPGPAFAAIYVFREIVNGVAIWVVARRKHGLRLTPGFAGRGAAAFFKAAVPQNVAIVFQIASLNVGLFGARAFLGEAELGAYAAAWRLVSPLLLLMGALVAPLLPVLAQRTRDRASFRAVLAPAAGIAAGIGVLGIAFVVTAGRDALRILYAKFSEGPLDAGPSLVWLGLVFGAVCIGAVMTTALLCLDGERRLRTLAMMALVLNAFVFAATGVRPFFHALAPALAAAAAMFLVPRGLSAHVRVALALAPAVAALGFMLVLGPGRELRAALREAEA
jgi:O-antigen/teichoic acid export membrane protein